MIRLVATLAAAALTAAAPVPERTAIMHATGSFVVRITPEAQGAAPESGLPTARMAIAKTFAGGLVGQATGTMLSAEPPRPATPRAMSRSTSSTARWTDAAGGSCCSTAAP